MTEDVSKQDLKDTSKGCALAAGAYMALAAGGVFAAFASGIATLFALGGSFVVSAALLLLAALSLVAQQFVASAALNNAASNSEPPVKDGPFSRALDRVFLSAWIAIPVGMTILNLVAILGIYGRQ